MITRKYSDYLQDILDCIENIQSFVGKYELSDFIADKKTIAAVLWNFQVLGEAAKHIPESVRAQYPDIPWDDMTGMRDKMTHAYFGIDLDVVWDTIKRDLPEVMPRIKRALEEISLRENPQK